MSKLIQCPGCGKKASISQFIPDSDSVQDFLSAPLDSNGNPINSASLSTTKSYICPWCGAKMEIVEVLNEKELQAAAEAARSAKEERKAKEQAAHKATNIKTQRADIDTNDPILLSKIEIDEESFKKNKVEIVKMEFTLCHDDDPVLVSIFSRVKIAQNIDKYANLTASASLYDKDGKLIDELRGGFGYRIQNDGLVHMGNICLSLVKVRLIEKIRLKITG
jgi:uncharacterized Zn finger protein (UPF0148 family)